MSSASHHGSDPMFRAGPPGPRPRIPREAYDLTGKDLARYWSRVDMSGPNGCWLWTGETNRHGYGRFTVYRLKYRTRLLAHRVALVLDGRVLEDGMIARHTCDNPPCVNPAHLQLGTQAENIADCIVRGRFDKSGLALGLTARWGGSAMGDRASTVLP